MKLEQTQLTDNDTNDLADDALRLLNYMQDYYSLEDMATILHVSLITHLTVCGDMNLIERSANYLNAAITDIVQGLQKKTLMN
jgi:hypothetical protein